MVNTFNHFLIICLVVCTILAEKTTNLITASKLFAAYAFALSMLFMLLRLPGFALSGVILAWIITSIMLILAASYTSKEEK